MVFLVLIKVITSISLDVGTQGNQSKVANIVKWSFISHTIGVIPLIWEYKKDIRIAMNLYTMNPLKHLQVKHWCNMMTELTSVFHLSLTARKTSYSSSSSFSESRGVVWTGISTMSFSTANQNSQQQMLAYGNTPHHNKCQRVDAHRQRRLT